MPYTPGMTPEATVEPKAKGALERVIGVFTSPKETFADIGARPSWVVPLIIVLVFQLAFMVLVGQHVGWDKIVAQQIEKSSQSQNMSAEQKEQAIQTGSKFAAGIGYVGILVGVP